MSIVLSADVPTQMEPSFISKKFEFWVEEIVRYCPQQPVTEMLSSLQIAIFNRLNLSNCIRA
jgi:hypothetical protein